MLINIIMTSQLTAKPVNFKTEKVSGLIVMGIMTSVLH